MFRPPAASIPEPTQGKGALSVSICLRRATITAVGRRGRSSPTGPAGSVLCTADTNAISRTVSHGPDPDANGWADQPARISPAGPSEQAQHKAQAWSGQFRPAHIQHKAHNCGPAYVMSGPFNEHARVQCPLNRRICWIYKINMKSKWYSTSIIRKKEEKKVSH